MKNPLLFKIGFQTKGKDVSANNRQKIHQPTYNQKDDNAYSQRKSRADIHIYYDLFQKAVKIIVAGNRKQGSDECHENAKIGKAESFRCILLQLAINHQ